MKKSFATAVGAGIGSLIYDVAIGTGAPNWVKAAITFLCTFAIGSFVWRSKSETE